MPFITFAQWCELRLRRQMWRLMLGKRLGLSPKLRLLWLPTVGWPLFISIGSLLFNYLILRISPGMGFWYAISFLVQAALNWWFLLYIWAPLWRKRTRKTHFEMHERAVAVNMLAIVPTLAILLFASEWLDSSHVKIAVVQSIDEAVARPGYDFYRVAQVEVARDSAMAFASPSPVYKYGNVDYTLTGAAPILPKATAPWHRPMRYWLLQDYKPLDRYNPDTTIISASVRTKLDSTVLLLLRSNRDATADSLIQAQLQPWLEIALDNFQHKPSQLKNSYVSVQQVGISVYMHSPWYPKKGQVMLVQEEPSPVEAAHWSRTLTSWILVAQAVALTVLALTFQSKSQREDDKLNHS